MDHMWLLCHEMLDSDDDDNGDHLSGDINKLAYLQNELAQVIHNPQNLTQNEEGEGSSVIRGETGIPEITEKGIWITGGQMKCTNQDCKTSNTPLWRKGPLGPRSLCNACGIKYMRHLSKDPNTGVEFLNIPQR